jgi:uncharacterized membrane protein (DUF2068 family)
MVKKSTGFLKFIIGYKAFSGLVELVIAFGFFKLINQNVEEAFTRLAASLNLDIDNRILSSVMKQVEMMGNGTIMSITFIVLFLGVLNLTEAWGLHLKRKWAEWLTVVATGILIPFELYKVVVRVTFFKVVILVVNTAIVYYLAENRKLFARKREAQLADE